MVWRKRATSISFCEMVDAFILGFLPLMTIRLSPTKRRRRVRRRRALPGCVEQCKAGPSTVLRTAISTVCPLRSTLRRFRPLGTSPDSCSCRTPARQPRERRCGPDIIGLGHYNRLRYHSCKQSKINSAFCGTKSSYKTGMCVLLG